jgi:hypothetical protein
MTFYPSAGAVDGYTQVSGRSLDWADLKAVATADSVNSGATAATVGMLADSLTDKWEALYRAILLFDTSGLPDDAVISSAVLSVRGSGKQDQLSLGNDFRIVPVTSDPASTSSLAFGDHDSYGSVSLAQSIAYGDLNTSGYNNYTLYTAGINAINKSGLTKFGLREHYNDVSTATPSWSNSNASTFSFYTRDYGDDAYSPKLVVTYSVPKELSGSANVVFTAAMAAQVINRMKELSGQANAEFEATMQAALGIPLSGQANVEMTAEMIGSMLWYLSGQAAAQLTARLDYEDNDISGMITRY